MAPLSFIRPKGSDAPTFRRHPSARAGPRPADRRDGRQPGASLGRRRAAASDTTVHRRGRAAIAPTTLLPRFKISARRRFELRVSGVGKFERRNGGALWAGVEPKEPVAALAAKVERALQQVGLEPEHRAFSPHITLARWNRGNAEAVDGFLRQNSNLRSEPFPVDRFILFESHLASRPALRRGRGLSLG